MAGMILISVAMGLILLSWRLQEDVYALAVGMTGGISLIWGFTWATPSAQLTLVALISSLVVLSKQK